jgi:hypothetical protein
VLGARVVSGVLIVAGAVAVAALVFGPARVARADDSPQAPRAAPSNKPDPNDKLAQKVAKLIPGKTTKAQVASALGQPWRTVQYNDMDQLEDEIWEYRGRDASGPYRVHIEFDHHDTVKIVGKIPDPPEPGGTRVRSVP